MNKIAVVILNYNGKKHLTKYLSNIIDKTGNEAQIIIGDNCSTDGSVEYLKQNFPYVKIIENDKNYGYAGGYNRILKEIEAEYYIILNSDLNVSENWILPVIELMNSDSKIAACSPKIMSLQEPKKFEYAGAAGGYIDKYGFPFCKGRIFTEIEEDHGQYDGDHEVFWCSGAAMFVKSDLFWKSGAFDEDFFAHMEEIDMCWRLKNMGYKIMSTSRSTVYHLGGGTLDYTSPFKTFLNFRNNLCMLYKNSQNSRGIAFKRKLIDGLAAMKYLLSFDFKNVKAILKAHREFDKWKMKLKVKKQENEKLIENYTQKHIAQFSIVSQFYLKRIKKFNELPLKEIPQ